MQVREEPRDGDAAAVTSDGIGYADPPAGWRELIDAPRQ